MIVVTVCLQGLEDMGREPLLPEGGVMCPQGYFLEGMGLSTSTGAALLVLQVSEG